MLLCSNIRPFLVFIMRIKVIELMISEKYDIEMETESEYVYGVETAAPIFCKEIGSANIEKLALLCLDNTNKIINFSIISMGNINSVNISVEQIVKTALLSNSSKVIVAHNHPSGIGEITSLDIEMTKKIGMLLKYFNIELIDSLVITSMNAFSIRESLGEKRNDRQ